MMIFRSRLARFGALVLLSLCLNLWSQVGASHAGTPPDRREFLQLLRQDRFDDLEVRLKQYLDDYQGGNISDHIVEQAYQSFASADPDLEPKLNAWIAARPDSHSARMARA